ncbi:hypothetical protein HHL23_13560 [Chryseobacterium sp. RP-3-3]|uniref:Uncharacterized protein n=1 Tax=Chryseobacterium antibioticum TaxID=2728847 RepID=A0A7Y0FSV0_9FLAO|nr:hypothetical protein [Chryseobacterium antibioticum]NML70814.1 hypothetical protein [Chryseobacterium antibioticum]
MKNIPIFLNIRLLVFIFCLFSFSVVSAQDSDGDGILNSIDLDDDNDGISDTAEGYCDTQAVYSLNLASTLAGATIAANGGTFNLVYTLTSGTAVPSLGNTFTVPFSYSDFNNSVNAQNHTWAAFSLGATRFMIEPNATSLYTGLPANNTTQEDHSGATPNSPDGWFRYFLNTNRISQLGTFTTTIGSLPAVSALSSYSSNTGLDLFSVFNVSGGSLLDSGFYAKMQLQNTTNTGGTATTLPLSVNYGNTYIWDYTAFTNTAGSGANSAGRGLISISQNTITYCNHKDTDGDGIPDYLDLDSDGDGCFDAIEGDENVTATQLNANGSINIGTTGGIGTTFNVNSGVPNLVNSGGTADIGGDVGQGIGSSIDATVNTCFCFKPGVLDAANTYPTKHGITALGRAGAENENWPMVRQSAWTVLESKEKGFVVNRVATTAGLASITNPVEGMMVYDEQADCLKIYTLKSGDTVMAWHCFTTQACPD